MSTPAPVPPAPATRRRVKKRVLIPLILLGIVLLAFVWLYIRGTWADTEVRDPKTTAEGPVTQLYYAPPAGTSVRCAVLVDAAPHEVWAVVTDYDKHSDFLPYVSEMASAKNGANVSLVGRAHSSLWGDWDIKVLVTHREEPDKGEFAAFWDEPADDETRVNRGGWQVSGKGDGKTLIVYNLQLEVSRYPDFLVRNILLDRVPKVVAGMRDEVLRRKKS
jgi:hypothetical protein